jgi:hypothetical protein
VPPIPVSSELRVSAHDGGFADAAWRFQVLLV